jgi:hypothetical protein
VWRSGVGDTDTGSIYASGAGYGYGSGGGGGKVAGWNIATGNSSTMSVLSVPRSVIRFFFSREGSYTYLPRGIDMRMVTTPRISNSGGVLFFTAIASSSFSSTSPACRGCAETVRAVRGTSNTSCAMPSVPGLEVYSGPRKAMLARVSEICSGGGAFLPDPWAGEGRCKCRPSVMCIPDVYAKPHVKIGSETKSSRALTFFAE